MNHWFKRYPRTAALLSGIIFLLSLFLFGELICRVTGAGAKHQWFSRPFFLIHRQSDGHPSGVTKIGIWRPKPGVWHRWATDPQKGDQLIYDVHYSFDKNRRRITPVHNPSQRTHFALFGGGSYVLGEGVHGHETLPYYFGETAVDYLPYNYGFSGYGPFDTLTQIRKLNLRKQIPQSDGIMVYVYIDDHIQRTIGSLYCSFWKIHSIYYEEPQKGVFVEKGTFESGRPRITKLYRALTQSRLFNLSGLNIPPFIMPSHIAKTARAIEGIEKAFHEKYPDGQFYLVIYPGSKHGKKLSESMTEKRIKILDFSNLFDFQDPAYVIDPVEGHPSARAHKELAEAIAKEISVRDRASRNGDKP